MAGCDPSQIPCCPEHYAPSPLGAAKRMVFPTAFKACGSAAIELRDALQDLALGLARDAVSFKQPEDALILFARLGRGISALELAEEQLGRKV